MGNIILLDNGHGIDTAGKCSPDGRLREYEFNRLLARRIGDGLTSEGLDWCFVVPEDFDVGLGERCRRVNRMAAGSGAVLLSLHVNASGNGGWGKPNGWSVFVAPKASGRSCCLANCLYMEAKDCGLLGDRHTPDCGFWRGNFAVLRDTVCPAVLTENMFMDNARDLEFLLSGEGLELLSRIHIAGIKNYLGLVR